MQKQNSDNKRFFSQISNGSIKGNTFDAKHIDQILKSEFSGYQNLKNTLRK